MSFQSDELLAGIVRILKKPSGETPPQTAGTGFFVFNKLSKPLIITCAHVIDFAEAKPGETVNIALAINGARLTARVEEKFWHEQDKEDVAILSLQESLSDKEKITSLKLGTSVNIQEHSFKSYGFPQNYSVEGIWSEGPILGETANSPLIQLSSKEIAEGFSGAPVLDKQTRRVVGMVTSRLNPVLEEEKTKDKKWQLIPVTMPETAFATPSKILERICPDLILDDICPYVGLEAFTQEKAEFFYGRKSLIDELIENLRTSSTFLAVVGSSGNGKSSVVQAGLFPKLSEVLGFQNSQIIKLRPGDAPEQTLAKALPDSDASEIEVVNVWKKCQKHFQSHNRTIIFIDQFEELFTLCSPTVQKDFTERLLELLKNYERITLIITIRSDFYGQLQNSCFGEWLKNSVVNVLPMAEEEIRSAIVEPARNVGLQLEGGLADLIISDLKNRDLKNTNNSLALLEFTLKQLWDYEHDNNCLTCTRYSDIGGVTGALAQRADSIYKSLNKQEQQLTHQIFTRLIRYGSSDVPDTRHRLPLAELYNANKENSGIQKLVNKFVDARLLVTSLDETTKKETVEIVHEALIQEWRELKKWIEQNCEKLIQRSQIELAAEAWRDNKYSNDYLLSAKLLNEAKKFKKEQSVNFPLSYLASKCIQISNRQKQKNLLKAGGWLVLPAVVVLLAFYPLLREVIRAKAFDTVKYHHRDSGTREALQFLTKVCRSTYSQKEYALQYQLNKFFYGDCPDLSGIDLSGANLKDVDLSYAHLERANFRSAHLERANFRSAHLDGADFRDAYLNGAVEIVSAEINIGLGPKPFIPEVSGADLSYARLDGADFRNAHLDGTELIIRGSPKPFTIKVRGANLKGANLSFAKLERADLRYANLEGASLFRVNLINAKLMEANLERTDLYDANLRYAFLAKAHLKDALLYNANLKDAFLYNANLNGANLTRANLTRANLTDADLTNADLTNAQIGGAVYLSYSQNPTINPDKNLTLEQVKSARNWEKAKYEKDFRAQLGLPPEPAK